MFFGLRCTERATRWRGIDGDEPGLVGGAEFDRGEGGAAFGVGREDGVSEFEHVVLHDDAVVEFDLLVLRWNDLGLVDRQQDDEESQQ